MSQVESALSPQSSTLDNNISADAEISMMQVSGLLAKQQPRKESEPLQLPTNVSSIHQLEGLPDECLSGDPVFPLQYCVDDEDGVARKYHLSPMFYSVIYILLVELLERFSFYGLTFTQTLYLTGFYNKHWNADMTSVSASSFVSISVAVAYTSPFVGAILADKVLGDYWTILLGAIGFYLPGLILIALTSIPKLLGPTFNTTALGVGLLFLWPMGTGMVKSLVNIFGAKQFHPVLQSSLIESYYVYFYMCINIGAFVGIILIPFIAHSSVTGAYWIPVIMLTCGVALFIRGTPRYVKSKPPFYKSKTGSNRRWKRQSSSTITTRSSVGLMSIFRICCLIIPFSIVYSQMATIFIVQGTVMKRAMGGIIDAASMNCVDTISVLGNGYWIGGLVYPALARRNIKVPTTYKFAMGTGFAALAIAWALIVEQKIGSHYYDTISHWDGGTKESLSPSLSISVLWQIPSYALVGIGEIFAVSTAYEVAFKAAPPNQKGISSALNLFCIGGIPNILCIGLYHFGARWFTNARGTTSISDIEDYVTARVSYYFVTLLIICFLGIGVNLLPWVRDWVDSVEDEAAEAIKTPLTTPRPTPRMDTRELKKRRQKNRVSGVVDESAALLSVKRHRTYMKEATTPVLYKMGSFRAGVTLQNAEENKRKRNKLARYLYAKQKSRNDAAGSLLQQAPPPSDLEGALKQAEVPAAEFR